MLLDFQLHRAIKKIEMILQITLWTPMEEVQENSLGGPGAEAGLLGEGRQSVRLLTAV